MYALNFFDTTVTRNALRAVLLTAACVLGMLIAYYATNVVLPLLVAALGAITAFVVTVVSALLSAAAYAVVTLAAVAVRMVVVLALVRALPTLWQDAVALYGHRDGLLLAGKALCYAGVVISVFVVALVWLPVALTACCTVLPQVGVVAGVLGGAIGLMKVG